MNPEQRRELEARTVRTFRTCDKCGKDGIYQGFFCSQHWNEAREHRHELAPLRIEVATCSLFVWLYCKVCGEIIKGHSNRDLPDGTTLQDKLPGEGKT